jgi:hypothetical protein
VAAVTPDVACDSVKVFADTTALIGAVLETLLITRLPASNTASNLALALAEIPPLTTNAPVLLLVDAVVLLIVIAVVVVAPRPVTVARVSASAGNAIDTLDAAVMRPLASTVYTGTTVELPYVPVVTDVFLNPIVTVSVVAFDCISISPVLDDSVNVSLLLSATMFIPLAAIVTNPFCTALFALVNAPFAVLNAFWA